MGGQPEHLGTGPQQERRDLGGTACQGGKEGGPRPPPRLTCTLTLLGRVTSVFAPCTGSPRVTPARGRYLGTANTSAHPSAARCPTRPAALGLHPGGLEPGRPSPHRWEATRGCGALSSQPKPMPCAQAVPLLPPAAPTGQGRGGAGRGGRREQRDKGRGGRWRPSGRKPQQGQAEGWADADGRGARNGPTLLRSCQTELWGTMSAPRETHRVASVTPRQGLQPPPALCPGLALGSSSAPIPPAA